MPTVDGIRESMRLLCLSSLGRSPASEEEMQGIAEVWCQVMPEVTDGQLVAATVAYLRSGAEWWPSPGQLLKRVPNEGTATMDADQAWAHVMHLIRRHGYMHTPSASELHADPQVVSAMQAGLETVGGWRALCMSEEREMAFAAKTFARVYDARMAASRATQEKAILALCVSAVLPEAPRLFPEPTPATAPAPAAPPQLAVDNTPDTLDELAAERTRRIERARALASRGGAK